MPYLPKTNDITQGTLLIHLRAFVSKMEWPFHYRQQQQFTVHGAIVEDDYVCYVLHLARYYLRDTHLSLVAFEPKSE